MSKHTPTPWKLIDEPRNRHYRSDDYATIMQHCWYISGPDHDSHFVADIITGRGTEGDANAEFIVRACNAHESLLAALHRLVSIRDTQRKRESEEFHISVETFMAMWDEADAEARAAIALAQPK